MKNNIQNLVFDLGGVIMNLDVTLTINSFRKLGIGELINSTGHHYKDPIFYEFEKGERSENEFREFLNSKCGMEVTDDAIDSAWNSMILDIPGFKVDSLSLLDRKFRIFLLSNTNSIHCKKFEDELSSKYGFEFQSLFEKVFYSHREGVRKPELDAYENVLNTAQIIPDQTLFIDDSLENISVAKSLNIQGFHMSDYSDFHHLLTKIL